MNEIGNQIREKRLNKNISLRKLSGKTGIAVSTIYRIENGTNKPHNSTLRIINDALEENKDA